MPKNGRQCGENASLALLAFFFRDGRCSDDSDTKADLRGTGDGMRVWPLAAAGPLPAGSVLGACGSADSLEEETATAGRSGLGPSGVRAENGCRVGVLGDDGCCGDPAQVGVGGSSSHTVERESSEAISSRASRNTSSSSSDCSSPPAANRRGERCGDRCCGRSWLSVLQADERERCAATCLEETAFLLAPSWLSTRAAPSSAALEARRARSSSRSCLCRCSCSSSCSRQGFI